MSFRKLVVCRQKVHVFFYISHVFCAKAVDFFRAMGVCDIQPVFRGSKSVEKRRACEDYTFYVARSIFRLRGIWSKARKPVTLPLYENRPISLPTARARRV